MNRQPNYSLVAILLVLLSIWVIAIAYCNNANAALMVDMSAHIEEIKAIDEEREGDSELFLTLNLSDIELLAKTVYGEARGCSKIEQSAVIWCILNRVDASGDTIEDIVTAPYQFTGYNSENPVTDEFVALVEDVLARWVMEKHCVGEVGRTLPLEYKWFTGNGKENIFRDKYDGDYTIWDWDCYNPYLTIQD